MSERALRGREKPDAIRGRLRHKNIVDPTTFERANYIKILQSYKSPHPSMPDLQLSRQDIDDVVTYIESLRTQP